MNNRKDLLDFLEFTKIFGFEITERDSRILVQKRPFFSFIFNEIDEDTYYFYIFTKTISWDIDGDRTDLHELMPILLVALSKIFEDYNFSMTNFTNEFVSDNEISYTYMFPSQPTYGIFKIHTESSKEQLKKLFSCIIFCYRNLRHMIDITCGNQFDYTWKDKELVSWAENIDKILKVNENNSGLYLKRINPDYFYYRNIKKNISIVKNEYTTNTLNEIHDRLTHKKLDGINSYLYIKDHIKNVIFHNKINEAKKILKKIENIKSDRVIPFDNFSILLGDEHFIIFDNRGGLGEFFQEKEKIRERYLNETFNLFYELPIKWSINNTKDSGLFEDLILELLEKENGILTVKKVAPTNQPDNGRDLIANYTQQYINPKAEIFDPNGKLLQKKMIIQCKTNLNNSQKQSIGKANVDIADTIYEYKPDGYLLVVNTQTSEQLTTYLEKLKARDEIDINWWNRHDIERRLRENPEIMNKYKKIVTLGKKEKE